MNDFYGEDDTQYLAYQAELEYQQYLNSEEFMAKLNAELAMIAAEKREHEIVDLIVESLDNQLVVKEN